ncbi:aldehyde ferredoxin oxidoreductase family protein [Candidatus Bipolaricaulota bacterium]|nr:aldehyde ferredoxin oxidoreductase family protein [Candidatus Bipolaricaulota bacterium]
MKLRKKLARVNLSESSVTKEKIPDEILSNFLGGRGLNSYLLLKHLDNDVKPLSPKNLLVFSTGLLNGSEVFSSGRLHLGALSPVSELLGSSNVGGYLGAELASNGILSLLLEGKADHPVYLLVDSEGIEIRDASQLWGLGTHDTIDELRSQLGEDSKIATIGPAGEKLTKIANIIVGKDYHAAGRTGMGAVMGSKNLKAVAVRPGETSSSSSSKVRKDLKEYMERIKDSPDFEQTKLGKLDVGWVEKLFKMGAGSAFNYQKQTFYEELESFGEKLFDYVTKRRGCHRCPVGCSAHLKITEGKREGLQAKLPAFEPLGVLGPKIGNNDSVESIYFTHKCDELGIDAIDVAGLIAFIMDLSERGLIPEQMTDDLPLDWGDTGTIEKLIEQIGLRSSEIGEILSKGFKEAVEKFGEEAEKYAFHVKGLALVTKDPRVAKGYALGQVVGSRGADFATTLPIPEYGFSKEKAKEHFGIEEIAEPLSERGKAEMVRETSRFSAVLDSVGLCKTVHAALVEDFRMQFLTRLVKDTTDLQLSPEYLFTIGERIVNAERLFNIRNGITPKDDTLPAKFIEESIEEGKNEGAKVDLDKMLTRFYDLMGWDSKGKPTSEKLKELGLDSF